VSGKEGTVEAHRGNDSTMGWWEAAGMTLWPRKLEATASRCRAGCGMSSTESVSTSVMVGGGSR
jgi:hypothetical protein